MYGINGKLLNVDLTMGRIWIDEIPENDFRKYLGGSGLAAKLIMERTNLNYVHYAPLDSRSPLIFMSGILVGTGVPTGCKGSVCARSPQTGIWNEGTVGGFFPTELKKTGFDGIYIIGKAKEPVYIWINDGKVSLQTAKDVWGKDTFVTDDILRQETHQKAKVACIGQAGENLSAMGNVMVDGQHPRTAGRGGLGAVMGSKNLKAIVVYGTHKPNIYNKEALMTSIKNIVPTIKEKAAGLTNYGTGGGVMATEKSGDMPIKNFLLGNWTEGVSKVCSQATEAAGMVKGKHAGFACPIRCGAYVEIADEEYKGIKINRPEYETYGGFGPVLLNDDLETIIIANHLCNSYGMDTISTSMTIGFAMEAFEKGLISLEDTGGLDLSWGNSEAIIKLLHMIAKQEGIGKWLTHGTRYAAGKIGPRADEFAMHVKGMELPMHDPRCWVSMALNYATATRGACHLESMSYCAEGGVLNPDLGMSERFAASDEHPDYDMAEMVLKMQHLMQGFNATGTCKLSNRGGVGAGKMAEWVSSVTGWDMSTEEFLKAGERLFNLKRLYNNYLGVTRKDDTLPARLLDFSRPSGGSEGKLPTLGKMLNEYYKLRQWTEDGIVKNDKLTELGLAEFIDPQNKFNALYWAPSYLECMVSDGQLEVAVCENGQGK